jgi:lysophospholipase L1-like esterase
MNGNVEKTLVCFGDSITQGSLGAAYVELLRSQLSGVNVINAGINGDTVLHLLQRYERDVLPHQPDVVLIFVGLNDLGTVYSKRSLRAYYRFIKRVPFAITPRLFARYYTQLIAALQAKTTAELVLCTLTTLGEQPADPIHEQIDAYSDVIRALAMRENLPLIDLRSAFKAAIEAEPRDGPPYHIWLPPLDTFAIRFVGQSYTKLQQRRGFRLLYDGAHLSDEGAALVVETMLPQLQHLLSVAVP